MIRQVLPGGVEVYEIGMQRMYIKTGDRNFAISEADITPEELVGIARDIAARQEQSRGIRDIFPAGSPEEEEKSIRGR